VDPVRPATAAKPASTMSPAEERRLRATAHEIESIFMTHMLKTMRQASGVAAPLSGQGQRVYREMMDEHLGRALAKGGGIGLADLLVRDVLRRQGLEKKPSSPVADVPTGPAGGLP
jgi:flagellar protein FlgJ